MARQKKLRFRAEGRDFVDKTRERLIELVAESDDALMEKYFENGTLEEADIMPNINKAIAQSKLCPVFAVSGATLVGLQALMNGIVDYAPDPAHHEAEYGLPVDAGPDAERIAAQVQRQRTVFSLLLPHRGRSVCRPHQRDENHQRQVTDGRQRAQFDQGHDGTPGRFAYGPGQTTRQSYPKLTPATSSLASS